MPERGHVRRDYKMGRIEVVCEGYDYPDDPYILKGSCGLEYRVERRSGRYPPPPSQQPRLRLRLRLRLHFRPRELT
ncbi:uncharacterized protein ACA1_087850, partial [Acanthamoeba castellanii str. Neff]